jgi:hypothetical protein
LQVIDRAFFNATGQKFTYEIDHSFDMADMPIIVVLAYYDYPAFPGVHHPALAPTVAPSAPLWQLPCKPAVSRAQV